MTIGIVLIDIDPASKRKVHDKLLKILAIKELLKDTGRYDLVARVEADDYEKIGQVVLNEIRKIEGVIDTKTLTGIGLKYQ